MSFHNFNHRHTSGATDLSDSLVATGVFGGVMLGIGALCGSPVPATVLAFAFTVFLFSSMYFFKDKSATLPLLCGLCEIVCIGLAVFYAPILFSLHVPFPLYYSILYSSYVLGLISGLWKATNWWFRIVSTLLAIVMLSGFAITTNSSQEAKTGSGDEATATETEWKIKLTVLDADQQPVAGALAECTSLAAGDKDKPVEFKSAFAKKTDEKGVAEFDMSNAAIAGCIALKAPSSDLSDAQTGYKPKAVIVLEPAVPNPESEATIKLDEAGDPGDPDSASVTPGS